MVILDDDEVKDVTVIPGGAAAACRMSRIYSPASGDQGVRDTFKSISAKRHHSHHAELKLLSAIPTYLAPDTSERRAKHHIYNMVRHLTSWSSIFWD